MNAIIKKATYLKNYIIAVEFADGKVSEVDVAPFLKSDIPAYLKIYLETDLFQKFHLANGNVVWGEDWDMVFPRDQLYEGKIKLKEPILF